MIARRVGAIRGVVQGVGFRPFVARLAEELGLGGSVRNRGAGVELAVEGPPDDLLRFDRRLRAEHPPAARLDAIEWRDEPPTGETRFSIDASRTGSSALAIPPDLAVCTACLAEVADPDARRFGYPFTNCTHCGPRFTIAEGAPYDRERTSMRGFPLCGACRREYGDPRDRRYHAQPIACPRCGPSLRLVTAPGEQLASGPEALEAAATALERGAIVALQGLGGFQLLVRADDERAVHRLRERKRRPAKPFALLVADLPAARALARIDGDEAAALTHSAAPIVLLRRQGGTGAESVAPSVAPRMGRLGIALPATPLHALLARRLPVPLVCTSGNLHDEPICIDAAAARERLAAVADVFLVHNRAILRRADDSVVHVVGGRMRALRAARGLTPVALPLPRATTPILALGGHLKQAPVLAAEGEAVLWPQVGDLHSPRARDAMEQAIADLEAFLGRRAEVLAVDRHPDYATTLWAERSGRRLVPVQHHHAHVASVLAEQGFVHAGGEEALGVAWDGAGLGADGDSWGGETLLVGPRGARRVGHLLPFPLIGGDRAARDGRRVLAGLFHAAGTPPPPELELGRYFSVAARAATTTSVGRLFDGVAALVGVAETSRFEGEAAMALEALAEPGARPYRCPTGDGVIDWRPMLGEMLAERHDPARVASRFHATLVDILVRVARAHRASVVALGGGCFQNALLLGEALDALATHGVRGIASERTPPGDGGLALGQAWVATC